MVSRCKRCGHTEAYAGPLLDGICGSCGDDMRQEALAEQYADLLAEWQDQEDITKAAYDAYVMGREWL